MMEIKLSFENLNKLAQRIIDTTKYMQSFKCDTPDICGKGAVCNSCWARSWAKETLNWIKSKNNK